MWGENRWVKANYAVQILAALLNEKDTFYIYRLNKESNGKHYFLSKNKRLHSIKEIKEFGNSNEGTPYEAVKNGAAIFKKKKILPDSFGERETDWLIIISDGGFDNNGAGIKEHACQFLSGEVGLKTKIAFVLIGSNGTEKVVKLWKQEAARVHVESNIYVYRANTDTLIGKMAQLAKDISGRDGSSVQLKIKKKNLEFRSEFPLQRITVLEQREGGILVGLRRVKGPEDHPLTVSSFGVQTPATKPKYSMTPIVGKVSHIHDPKKEVMPAGVYSLAFDKEPQEKNIQLLLEPAVDFMVTPIDSKSQQLLKKKNGQYRGCIGHKVIYRVNFLTPGGGNPGKPLISKEVEKKLDITGILGKHTVPFSKASGEDSYLSSPIEIAAGKNSLGVEARYPGYFNIKSKAMVINGENCVKDGDISSVGGKIPVPYTRSSQFQENGTIPLKRVIIGSSEPCPGGGHTVTVSKIPKGIKLEINGKSVTRDANSTHIDLADGEELKVKIFNNNEFISGEDVKLKIDLERSSGEPYQNSGEIVLEPIPRQIELIPNKRKWSASFDKIEKTSGPTIDLRVDGAPVSQQFFDSYDVSFSSSGRLGVEIIKDPAGTGYTLQVKPYFIDCLTTLGEIRGTLLVKGPFPNEQKATDIVFYVEPIVWWKIYWRCILRLLLFCTTFTWLVGCIRKRRFATNARIVYQRENVLIEVQGRPDSYPLAGGTQRHRSRLAGFLKRWLWPFEPEKCMVEGLLFLAGGTSNTIFLAAKSQADTMELDCIPLDSIGAKDLLIGVGSVLLVSETKEERKTYTFERIQGDKT